MRRIEELDARSRYLRELVAAARATIAGESDLVSGVRRIVALANALGIGDEEHVKVLRGFDDDASERIRDESRELWSTEFLAEHDALYDGFEKRSRDGVIAECLSIVARFDEFEKTIEEERERVRREAKKGGWEL